VAAGRDDDVLTSDPDDLKRLAPSTRHPELIALHHV
jgi:hypothetical protein